jgi:hypothetical protein
LLRHRRIVISRAPTAFDRVWALVSAEAVERDDKPELVGWMQRLCRAAVRALPSTGAAVSIMSLAGGLSTVAASDAQHEVIEDLQFTLGEGPCIDACASGRPVMVADLSGALGTPWPGYASAAQDRGVQATFAFPLQIGAARLGALNIYRSSPGRLSRETVAEALTFADAAMTGLLNAQQRSNESADTPTLDESLDSRFELYQAQGMVKVQLGISLHEAIVRIRAHAFANDRPLGQIADDIVTRKLVLEADA